MYRHRIESPVHATRMIADWIPFYNQNRPHQALKMTIPDVVYAGTLTKSPEPEPAGHCSPRLNSTGAAISLK